MFGDPDDFLSQRRTVKGKMSFAEMREQVVCRVFPKARGTRFA